MHKYCICLPMSSWNYVAWFLVRFVRVWVCLLCIYIFLMQEKHESVILKINQEIHLLNKSHNMHTPDLPSPWYITPRASWDADMEGLWTACIPTITWRTNGSTHSTGSWTSIEVPQISYHQQNQRNHSLRMRNMTVTALPNEAGSTDDADYVCEWIDCPDIPLPFQLADLCRLIDSECWCLGQTLSMAPQSLTRNGWDWLNTLATLWCHGRLVKAALLVGVLGSMSRAESVMCASSERQSSVDISADLE